jgi:hypothetical protein
MGYRMHQLLATLYVASSLALEALGGSDPSSGFHLCTLSYLQAPSHQWARWGYDSCILCWCGWRDARGVGEAGKHSLPGSLLRLRGPSHLITDTAGFRASGRPCTPLYPCAPSIVLSSHPSLCLDKKEKRGKKGKSKKEKKEIGRNTEVL